MSEYEAVIGLECHVQLDTRSKMFSAAAASFGEPPNTQIDPHTLGLPGSLPVPNRRAVEFALRMGLACGSRIRLINQFSRKHYFYPDLPKGYQISQFDAPICEGGALEFLDGTSGAVRRVRLERIHLEEDAGKNLHVTGSPLSGALLDYNRAGVPLIEVVSKPELRSAAEAGEYLRAIRQLVRYLGISDGNMEEGSLRCDANVSIRPPGSETLGQKVELKNINSFRFVEKAIEYELGRQAEVLRSGGRVIAETRGWDAERGVSRSQRSKEEAHDYRYFPDPDLPPLAIEPAWLEEIRGRLPELPLVRRERYIKILGLTPYDATVLTAEAELARFFDEVLLACGVPAGSAGAEVNASQRALAQLCKNWIASELLGLLHRDGKELSQSPVSAAALAELLKLVSSETISGKQAKEVFARMYRTGESAAAIAQSLGLRQLTDPSAIEAACRKVVFSPENQKQVEKYAQNPKLLGFFVGKVLAETGGQARPDLVSATLIRLLAERK